MTTPGAPLPGSGSICLTFDFDRYQLPATCFIPGNTADSFPDAVREIAGRGHEISHHGYLHESPTEYLGDPGGERAMYESGLAALDRVAGGWPADYRFARMTEVAEEFRARAGGPAT